MFGKIKSTYKNEKICIKWKFRKLMIIEFKGFWERENFQWYFQPQRKINRWL